MSQAIADMTPQERAEAGLRELEALEQRYGVRVQFVPGGSYDVWLADGTREIRFREDRRIVSPLQEWVAPQFTTRDIEEESTEQR